MKKLLSIFLTASFLAACASNGPLREAQQLAGQGKYEEALPRLEAVLRQSPNSAEARMAFASTREKLAMQWLDQAAVAAADGRFADAEASVKRALALDQGNSRGRKMLEAIQAEQRRAKRQQEAETAWAYGDADTAMTRVKAILDESPDDAAALKLRGLIESARPRSAPDEKLAAALSKPLTIGFKDANLKQVFELLTRIAGINFVFDKDVESDQQTTIFMQQATVKDLLSAILMTQQLEQRVIDASTIVIYSNTPAKAREYQPLTIKTFYLSNADAKSVANTLRTILKARDLVADEKMNMIVIRDTPEVVRLAEKLLASNDLPEPEVMLEVEILEVSRGRLLDLGIRWPNSLTLSPLTAADGGALSLADLRHSGSASIGASFSSMILSAVNTDSAINLLANPRIRTRNRETAKVLIGDRVPNITTTATATGFIAESVQYVDVGLKLEVQPTIYLDNEVAIRINLEVSSIVNQVKTTSGTLAYQIGTRNASTVLRLKDGENQVLAGLISDAERSSANRIPGLGEIPLVGRLFGSSSDSGEKTELMLSITPRLVRSMKRPAAGIELDAGTEASMRSRDPKLSIFTEIMPATQAAATTESSPSR